MKAFLFLIAVFCSPLAKASELEEAVDFFGWLEQHAKDFAICEPTKDGDNYVLCDKTKVSRVELEKLFKMKAKDLVSEIEGKGLKVELVCAAGSETPALGQECVKDSKNKMFAEISSLHGKYLPEEKTILIRNSANPGSLVHEYVHSLQSANGNEVYGKIYKKRRNEIQRSLGDLMDKKIATIQDLEKKGKKADAKLHLQEFMLASNAMRGFAPWQDLIDERGIFLLYLKYGQEFGAAEDDLKLARKNMGFICKNPKLSKLIPEKQCKF